MNNSQVKFVYSVDLDEKSKCFFEKDVSFCNIGD